MFFAQIPAASLQPLAGMEMVRELRDHNLKALAEGMLAEGIYKLYRARY